MRSTFPKNVLKMTMLVGAGLLLTAAISFGADVYLQTQSFTKDLPDGPGIVHVPMWGFVCDPAAVSNPDCEATASGPPILHAAAGSSLTIHVSNTLPLPVSIVIPGQAQSGGSIPQKFVDDQGNMRVRSFTNEAGASGGTADYTFSSLRPGTYLYQSGTFPSLQVPMGLYGALVVGPATGSCTAGQPAYNTYNADGTPNENSCYDADTLLLFSEIDAIQNKRVAAASAVGLPTPTCEKLADWIEGVSTAYPCTLDFNPSFLLVNGEFGGTDLTAGLPGDKVLLRFLNAGLRSRIPSIVGLDMGLIAEDGNPKPGLVKRQSGALVAAGKTLDVMLMPDVDVTLALSDSMATTMSNAALANLVVGSGSLTPPVTNLATNDVYNVIEDTALVQGDAGGVLDNDPGLSGASVVSGPLNGTLDLGSGGGFTYTPDLNFSGTDGFTYSATDGTNSYSAQVTLNVSFVNDAPMAGDDGPYVNSIGESIKVDAAHGVLGNDSDPDGDALTAILFSGPSSGTLECSGVPGLCADGSFTYIPNPGSTAPDSFMYQADDGTTLSASVTVTLNLNAVANITLDVHGPAGPVADPVTSYRWIVQEDKTYNVNPAAPPAPKDSLSTNFHKSYMPVVAQGCVGLECPQLNMDVPEAASVQIVSFDQVALDPEKRYYVSVLPNDAGSGEGHSIGGAQIPVGTNNKTISVIVNNQPIPTSQLSVIAFEDNSPTNGVPDPGEPPLGGWSIVLEDAGGRYGISGGTMSQDAFGNSLKNSLLGTPGCPGAAPEGVILTCPDGTALIKDLPPAKIGVVVVPPAGLGIWTQTSTIEGTKLQDNWIKAGEPPFLVEFGAPGYHAFLGFVNPAHTTVPPGPPGQQTNSISGNVTMVHTARAPDFTAFDSGSYEGLAHTRAWVGLNSNAGAGPNIKTVQAEPDGSFTMDGIPDGTYQLVIWDDYLDQIIAYQTVIVPGGGNVGNIPVNTWFGRHEHNVFLDANGNGVRDEGEAGLPDQNVNLRFRDGTVEQSFPTDTEGFVPFDQVFPYGAWQVAEIDYTRFKPTGVTVTVDGGGPVADQPAPYTGLLHPQEGSPRTDTEPAPVLLEGFQSMPGMTSLFEWGKKPYDPGENGGIAGIVFYSSTRGENDPRLTVGDPWEPGIAAVKVRLYREVARSDGTTALSLVREVETDSWDNALPSGCPGEITPNPFVNETLDGDATRCFDGIRNFEQVRPGAIFDGGYAFAGPDITPGTYVVEVVPPPGYEVYKEEDKNVDFGDSFVNLAPAAFILPGGAVLASVPDQAMVLSALAPEPGLAQPPCVGPDHLVPAELSLFPGVETYAPFAGAMRPLCTRKRVVLSDQSQAAADFHLFTSTPVAGQFHGLITDDVATETNPAAPSFGEKWGPAFMPFSMRDFNGQEFYRGYSDAFGLYNGFVNSTFTANVPVPSGYSPAMHFVCLNDPGPIPDPVHPGQMMLDPLKDPRYGIFCYTAQFMPGTTTYLDTPILPQAAFAAGFNPVDCAFPSGTPAITYVDGTGAGPLVAAGGTLTIHSEGMVPVSNPDYEGPLAAPPQSEPTVMRDHGFGATQGSGSVTLNDIALTGVSWSDDVITGTVPVGTPAGAYQLIVTRDNGNSTVNTVTVTVGVEDATVLRVSPGPGAIQAAIDAANPGDLILVEPGEYSELVVMWKPVRLQGSGPATFINALKRPDSKLQDWRDKVQSVLPDVDLLPGQPGPAFNLIGGGLLGTELGAGITVLAKNNGSFLGNPSRIDGFTVTGADGGGGIFVNAYAHNLQISNNDVNGNSGVIHGGIRVGHVALAPAGNGPFGYNANLNIHHNAIRLNGSQADNGAGGGLSLCTGTDNYHVFRNFVCGNFTLGEGAGIAHFGLSTPGLIDFNQILFNQSYNQGLNQSGGGLLIAGENPPAGTALTRGAGNVAVDANLIKGNQAGTGHGGGVRTQSVNGHDVELSPSQSNNWWRVRMTNNMIVNNVAAWSGGGISLDDTVNASIVLNTIVNNDSTATVGSLIDAATNQSITQPAGISSERNSLALEAIIPGNSNQKEFSNAELTHNIIWHNRAFIYDGNGPAPRLLPELTYGAVGDCPTGANYFDLGVLDPGFSLNPQRSILTSTVGYPGNNSSANPLLLSGYCNGARKLTPGPMQVAAEAAEGGNFVDVRFGPLTQAWPAGSQPWDYHIQATSPARDYSPTGASTGVTHDFDNQARPQGPRVDLGADEIPAGTVSYSVSFGTLSGGTLNFGNISGNGTQPSVVTITVSGLPVTFQTLTVTTTSTGTGGFTKGSDTCSLQTINPGSSCSVTVNFQFNGGNQKTGTLAVPHNGFGLQGLALTGQ